MKILIIDDHPLVSAGLARLLTIEFRATIVDAPNAEEGLRRFRIERPDLTILDLNLPDRSGLSLIKQFRQTAPNCPVLVLSMLDEAVTATACLNAGAIGYVSKNAAPAVVLDAIRAAMDGNQFLDPGIAGKTPGDRVVVALADLPAGDLELLRLILGGARGSVIAERLGVSEKTIANRKSLLRSRLGVANDIELLRVATAAGFRAP